MKCFGCGVEKDLEIKELYSYPEDGTLDTEEPIPALFVLECAGKPQYKAVVVCHECFHKLDPDMWISEGCWKSLKPIVAYEDLPVMRSDEDKQNPAAYQ